MQNLICDSGLFTLQCCRKQGSHTNMQNRIIDDKGPLSIRAVDRCLLLEIYILERILNTALRFLFLNPVEDVRCSPLCGLGM